jgi:hypothetical protein
MEINEMAKRSKERSLSFLIAFNLAVILVSVLKVMGKF